MPDIAALDAEMVSRFAAKRELKTLVFDIERLPGRFAAEFWDLNAFKNRRIHPDMVTEWPRTICAAWQWYGAKKVEFAAEWVDGTQTFAEVMWQAMDQADIVVGHNARRFDVKHLNTLFRDHGLRPPSPFKTIDTLTSARAAFGDESMTLDALCTRLGIARKTDKYDPVVARNACEGDAAAQRRIAKYNKGDIVATAGLYTALLPWIKGHPHVAPVAGLDEPTCPRCASTQVARNGIYSPAVYVYAMYTCNTCGGAFKAEYQHRGPSVRAL